MNRLPLLLVLMIFIWGSGCADQNSGSVRVTAKDTSDAGLKSPELKSADPLTDPEPKMKAETPAPKEPGIVLYEDSIGFLPLPFPVGHVEPSLENLFRGFTVKQETGHQDGPDFFMHSIYEGEELVGFFAMEPENRYNISEVILRSSAFADQYGVRPGDPVAPILSRRKGGSVSIGDHFQFYLWFPSSNLLYLLDEGTVDFDPAWEMGMDLPADDFRDWKVKSLIWQPLHLKKTGQ